MPILSACQGIGVGNEVGLAAIGQEKLPVTV